MTRHPLFYFILHFCENWWEYSGIFCITVKHMHNKVICTLNAHSRSVPVRFGVKVCIFTVAIVVCDSRKLKSSLLTFPLYQKNKRKKNHSQRRGEVGGEFSYSEWKLNDFFQHSFWSFCSALEVKQNRLTRVEACAGNMSPRAGKKWAAAFRQWESPTQYRTGFFF